MTEPKSANDFKLKKKVFIKGTITAMTGLHIGGSSIGISIGGVDAVVIRNPLTNDPYIPGSSLRGKMRSLMEKACGEMHITIQEKVKEKIKRSEEYKNLESISDKDLLPQHSGKITVSAEPSRKANSDIGKLFGVSADNEAATPTRLIVRDAKLNEK